MAKRRRDDADGFSLVEILATVAIIAILAALSLGGMHRYLERAQVAKCIGNLQQLGTAAASYAADNNNNWPYYGDYAPQTDAQAWVARRVRSGAVWTALGKTYPYHQDNRLFYCPADQTATRTVGLAADWRVNGSGSIDGTYLIRGYGQTKPRPLAKIYAGLGRIAIASCQWAYAASNPVKLPLSFHEGIYPVLFSDGSVESSKFPDNSIDKENPPSLWDSNTKQTDVWLFFDGKLGKELKL